MGVCICYKNCNKHIFNNKQKTVTADVRKKAVDGFKKRQREKLKYIHKQYTF